jgi:adenosine deaminase
MEIEAFILDLPKVELHIHIEGTLSPELRWQLGHKNGIPLPFDTFEELEASYRPDPMDEKIGADGLAKFLKQYFEGLQVLRTASDYHELGMAYFRKAASMNVRHAEVFFDPQAHTERGVALGEVMKGLQDAQQEAHRELGMTCDYIMCFLRTMSAESAEAIYDLCEPYRHTIFCGIGTLIERWNSGLYSVRNTD